MNKEKYMVQILIATSGKDSLLEFSKGLTKDNAGVVWVEKCEDVFAELKNNKYDLLITDESLSDTKGLECIEKVVFENPFLNTASISSLSAKDYHEESEGLGVLMQIPVNPGYDDGVKMLDYLNNILSMTNPDLKKRID